MQTVNGRVIRGSGYGRRLGFPTANLDRREYRRQNYRFREGVYAGEVLIQPSKKSYKAGIVIGPKDRKGLPRLEAHLLSFRGNLYGKKLTFKLCRYLRPFKKYRTEAALQRQISRDLKKIGSAYSRGTAIVPAPSRSEQSQ